MKSKRDKKFFSPILFSTIVIIIPSLVSLVFLLRFSINNSVEFAEKTNERMLYQIRDQIESVFSEMETVSLSLVMNPGVNSVFRILNSEGELDYYSIYEVQNNLPRYELSNKFISGTDIIYRNRNLVISPSGSIIDFYGFISGKLFPAADMEKIKNFLWDRENCNEIVATEGGLWYMRSFPLEAKSPQALIIIELNKTAFLNLLSFFDIGDYGVIEIIKNGKSIITYPKNQQDAPGIKMLTNSISSKDRKWEVVSKVPYSHVLNPVKKMRTIQIAVTLISIITTFFLGFFLIKWNSKPLLNLINRLSEDIEEHCPEAKNEYEVISTKVDYIIKESHSIKNKLILQKSLLQKSYIGNLIRGEYGDSMESDEIAQVAGLSSDVFPVAVFILKNEARTERGINSFYNQNIMGNETIKLTDDKLKTRIFSYPLHEGGLLFIVKAANIKKTEKFLAERLLEHLSKKGLKCVSLFYGGIVNDPEGIYNAYTRAEFLAMTTAHGTAGFRSCNNIPLDVKTFIYPIEWEVKLLTFIRAGNIDRVLYHLDEIERVNFIENDICAFSKKQLINQLAGTLSRFTKEIQNGYEEVPDPKTAFEQIKEKIVIFSEMNAKQRDTDENELRKKIITFLNVHYSDPGLTLYHLAEYTDVAESNLYYIFKKLFGKTFASYLETLRIKKSTELLSADIKIIDVARLTGFGNAQTFRRVFKKITGITPSGFTESLGKKKQNNPVNKL